MNTPSFLQALTLLNLAWNTSSRSPGKSLQQIVNEMQAQVRTQPVGSFMATATDSDVEFAVFEMETNNWVRLETNLYFITEGGLEVLRQLRPLLQTLTMLSTMVTL